MSKSIKKNSKKLKQDSTDSHSYKGFDKNPPKLKVWMKQANKQLETGNYQKAIALFDQVI